MLVIALLAALVAWAVTSGGGGGGAKDDGKPGGSDPAPSITPGPSGSGPVVGQPPGGRDESGDSGSRRRRGIRWGRRSLRGRRHGRFGHRWSRFVRIGGYECGHRRHGWHRRHGFYQQVPAGSPLPDCAPSALRLSLRTEISYAPGDKPEFRLGVRNTSAADCKADLGPKSAVLTITEAA